MLSSNGLCCNHCYIEANMSQRWVYYNQFGSPDVLRVGAHQPRIPPAGWVRVRVHAVALNPKDILLRKGHFGLLQGYRFPKGTAHDFAGQVDAVGSGVHRFEVGQDVFGMQPGSQPAAAADTVCVPQRVLAPKPKNLTYEEAAGLPLAGLTALQALRDCGQLQPTQHVLIRAAAGGVGSLAVQIAKAMGARVSAICSSRNVEKVQSLGAQEVFARDLEPKLHTLSEVDIYFDTFGNQRLQDLRSYLTPHGRLVSTLPHLKTLTDILKSWGQNQKAKLVIVRPKGKDLELLAQWAEEGQLRPVTDSIFALKDMARAHQRLETRRCIGKVIVRVQE